MSDTDHDWTHLTKDEQAHQAEIEAEELLWHLMKELVQQLGSTLWHDLKLLRFYYLDTPVSRAWNLFKHKLSTTNSVSPQHLTTLPQLQDAKHIDYGRDMPTVVRVQDNAAPRDHTDGWGSFMFRHAFISGRRGIVLGELWKSWEHAVYDHMRARLRGLPRHGRIDDIMDQLSLSFVDDQELHDFTHDDIRAYLRLVQNDLKEGCSVDGVAVRCPDTSFVLLLDDASLQSMSKRRGAVPHVTVLDARFDTWTRQDPRYGGHFRVALEAVPELCTLITVGGFTGGELWVMIENRKGMWTGVPECACMGMDGVCKTCDYDFGGNGTSRWLPNSTVLTDMYCQI